MTFNQIKVAVKNILLIKYLIKKNKKNHNTIFDLTVKYLKKYRNNLPKWYRKYMIKQILPIRPKYEINKNYIKAKEFYNNFYNIYPDNYKTISNVKLDDIVYISAGNFSVKGERYNEYYINQEIFYSDRLYVIDEIVGDDKVLIKPYDEKEAYNLIYKNYPINFKRLKKATNEEILDFDLKLYEKNINKQLKTLNYE